jgi:hypothetical protein
MYLFLNDYPRNISPVLFVKNIPIITFSTIGEYKNYSNIRAIEKNYSQENLNITQVIILVNNLLTKKIPHRDSQSREIPNLATNFIICQSSSSG